MVCHEERGNTKRFVCFFHGWIYDTKGNLIGLPFRKGVKADGRVNGGMPEDFALADHGLTRLRVEDVNGVVFASFDRDVPPVREVIEPGVTGLVEPLFDIDRLAAQALRALDDPAGHRRVPPRWVRLGTPGPPAGLRGTDDQLPQAREPRSVLRRRRTAIVSDTGPFTDPDGFVWEARRGPIGTGRLRDRGNPDGPEPHPPAAPRPVRCRQQT